MTGRPGVASSTRVLHIVPYIADCVLSCHMITLLCGPAIGTGPALSYTNLYVSHSFPFCRSPCESQVHTFILAGGESSVLGFLLFSEEHQIF